MSPLCPITEGLECDLRYRRGAIFVDIRVILALMQKTPQQLEIAFICNPACNVIQARIASVYLEAYTHSLWNVLMLGSGKETSSGTSSSRTLWSVATFHRRLWPHTRLADHTPWCIQVHISHTSPRTHIYILYVLNSRQPYGPVL